MYYVYEHWRPDLNLPFYVGKGSKDRCDPTRTRNEYHTRIKMKLRSLGLNIEVRIILSEVSEEEALCAEIKQISFWRSKGIKLANATAGGDGLKSPTEETRQKMKEAAAKRWAKIEEREKVSVATKIAIARPEVKQKVINSLVGRKITEETKAKMRAAHKGKIKSQEHIAKIAAAQFGNKRGLGNKSHLGQKMSDKTRAKMKQSQQARRLRELEAFA